MLSQELHKKIVTYRLRLILVHETCSSSNLLSIVSDYYYSTTGLTLDFEAFIEEYTT